MTPIQAKLLVHNKRLTTDFEGIGHATFYSKIYYSKWLYFSEIHFVETFSI